MNKENLIKFIPYLVGIVGLFFCLGISITGTMGVLFVVGLISALFIGWDNGWGKYATSVVRATGWKPKAKTKRYTEIVKERKNPKTV